MPSWKGRPNPAVPGDARSKTPGQPDTCPAQETAQASAPRLCPPSHDAHATGGACGGVLPRLRNPVVRRLDPAHSGGHRVAPGSGGGYRARLYRQELSSLPTPLSAPSATGRRGDGPAASGGQPGQPDRHAPRGGDCPLAPSNGICAPSMGCASAWEPSWLRSSARRKGPRAQWIRS